MSPVSDWPGRYLAIRLGMKKSLQNVRRNEPKTTEMSSKKIGNREIAAM